MQLAKSLTGLLTEIDRVGRHRMVPDAFNRFVTCGSESSVDMIRPRPVRFRVAA